MDKDTLVIRGEKTAEGKKVHKAEHDLEIKAIKDKEPASVNVKGFKSRLYLDVDGTLVAMEFDPDYMGNDKPWGSVYRTDFLHWLNSIYSIIDELCEVYVLTNFSKESELQAKEDWLKNNLMCKYKLILNEEGVTKSLFVKGKTDILVDDTLRNLIEWNKAGGTQFAYQYVTCEKGRRRLLRKIIDFSKGIVE